MNKNPVPPEIPEAGVVELIENTIANLLAGARFLQRTGRIQPDFLTTEIRQEYGRIADKVQGNRPDHTLMTWSDLHLLLEKSALRALEILSETED